MSIPSPNFSGQHLLTDKRLIDRMIDLYRPGGPELVLDIGAGKGALTLPMAERGWTVLAVEYDAALASKLRERTAGYPNVRILERDVRTLPLPRRAFGVIANIPFSITTPVLGMLLDRPSNSFMRGLLIVELGAAYRFTADPVVDPRVLGWRMHFDLRIAQRVPRDRFSPPPRVDAALLRIERRPRPLIPAAGHTRFAALAAYALREPGMSAADALDGVFTAPQLKHLVRTLRINRNDPIGRLSERQWAVVYETMRRHVPPSKWPRRPKRRGRRENKK